jgi:hypothetical protein
LPLTLLTKGFFDVFLRPMEQVSIHVRRVFVRMAECLVWISEVAEFATPVALHEVEKLQLR